MTDIYIEKHRGSATIHAKSEVGARWLRANITNPSSGMKVSIQLEFLEDFIKELKLDSLEVEEK